MHLTHMLPQPFGSTTNLAASALRCRASVGSLPFTPQYRDAIAFAMEAGHSFRYILLAYAIVDDQWDVVLLHHPVYDLTRKMGEWNAVITERLVLLDAGPDMHQRIDKRIISIDNLSQIQLTVNEITTFALRKPYVDDDYRWIRVMPISDDADLPPIGFADDWPIWSRATPVPSIMRGIFAPNGEPSPRLQVG